METTNMPSETGGPGGSITDQLELDGTSSPTVLDLSWPMRITIASLSLGAGVIHFAMVPPHAAEWLPLGISFALAGVFQLVFAMVVIARPTKRWVTVGALASLAFVAAWALTRTVGFPVGPMAGEVEAVSSVDLLCAVLEGLVVVVSGLAIASPRLGATVSMPKFVGAAAVPALAVVALTTAALASPAGTHEHGAEGHGHETASADHHHVDGMEHSDDHDHGSADPTEADAASASSGDHADDHAHPGVDDPLVSGEGAMDHDHSTMDHDHDTMDGIEHKGSGEEHVHECTAPTPEQQSAADDLVARTQAASAKYEDFDLALSEGYTPITPPNAPIVHYGRIDYMTDGKILDPAHIESLMYGFDKDRTPYFLGSMYLNDTPTVAPPTPGGCLTSWHDHTNLCIAPGKGMVAAVSQDGTCPAGSSNEQTSQMIHVWSIPLAGGPLSHEAAPTEVKAAVLKQKLGR